LVNRILFVCDTYKQARHRFNECIHSLNTNQNIRVNSLNMVVELDTYSYEFIGLGSGLLNKVLGKEYNKIVISELATEEQVALLKSRERIGR
jgi:hypothetical protein